MISEQQIRDMEPGRELDELAITRIMGIPVIPSESFFWTKKDAQFPFVMNDKEFGMCLYEDSDDEDWAFRPFNPSTDISAANEMLEKFKSYQCTKMHDVLSQKDSKYRVIVAANKNAAYGDTLPLAACRAALIAILRGGSEE